MNKDELKQKLESIDLEDLRIIIEAGLEIMYDKLKEEGFGDNIIISESMDNGYNSIVITDIDGMQSGNINYNYQTFRLM